MVAAVVGSGFTTRLVENLLTTTEEVTVLVEVELDADLVEVTPTTLVVVDV